MQPDQLIRLECLKLALTVPSADRGGRPHTALAAEYETFVRGADKAGEEGAAPAPAHDETAGQGARQPRPRR
jgi:hypothetical protein